MGGEDLGSVLMSAAGLKLIAARGALAVLQRVLLEELALIHRTGAEQLAAGRTDVALGIAAADQMVTAILQGRGRVNIAIAAADDVHARVTALLGVTADGANECAIAENIIFMVLGDGQRVLHLANDGLAAIRAKAALHARAFIAMPLAIDDFVPVGIIA